MTANEFLGELFGRCLFQSMCDGNPRKWGRVFGAVRQEMTIRMMRGILSEITLDEMVMIGEQAMKEQDA